MELRDLHTFVVVKRLGSVTSAAEQLHLTQPAISRRIQRIESELNLKLFERIGIKLIPTPPGEIFYRRCLNILREMEEGIQETQNAVELPPYYKVGIDGTLANHHFSEKFRVFSQVHSTIDFSLCTARSDELSEKVALGELDLAVRYFKDLIHDNLEQMQISSERFVIICSTKTAQPLPVTISDLNQTKWIIYERNRGTVPYTSLLDHLLVTHDIYNEHRRMYVDSLTAQKRLVEAEFGLAFVPISGVEEEIRNGSLRILEIDNFTAHAPIYGVFRKTSTCTDLSRKFISILSLEQ